MRRNAAMGLSRILSVEKKDVRTKEKGNRVLHDAINPTARQPGNDAWTAFPGFRANP